MIGAFGATLLWLGLQAPAQGPSRPNLQESYPFPLAPQVPEDREVVVLASGVRYSILHPGAAESAGARRLHTGDFVRVHFSAWYEDGRLCDSSVLRNEPVKTWVGKSILGWNEVLGLMTKGARWKVTIPADQCAGPEGALPVVPRTDTLIFEIELLDVLHAPTFHAARPAETKVTPGGLKYEVLQPGAGDPPTHKNKILALDYGLWTTSGTLLDSAARQGALFEIKAAQLDAYFDLKFMKEATAMLRPGARLRFEVPPEQCFGAQANPGLPENSVTVWELELVHVHEPRSMPAFVLPDEGKSRKTDTGLIYEIVREGNGRKPTANAKVTVNYALWLVTGSVFDASFDRGEPVRLDLSDPGMLPGLREALLLMSEGAAYRCRLSADHAYGPQGWVPYIGPNADLILYLELVSVG